MDWEEEDSTRYGGCEVGGGSRGEDKIAELEVGSSSSLDGNFVNSGGDVVEVGREDIHIFSIYVVGVR